MDRMSTSIIFDFNANDVDIMVFEPCVLSPPPPRPLGGGYDTWSRKTNHKHGLVFIKVNMVYFFIMLLQGGGIILRQWKSMNNVCTDI